MMMELCAYLQDWLFTELITAQAKIKMDFGIFKNAKNGHNRSRG